MNQEAQHAELLYRQRRFTDAADAFRRALHEEPEQARYHALLALCLLEDERYDDAQREAETAIGEEPDEPLNHYVLASVLLRRGRPREAAAPMNEALRLDPEDPGTRVLAASIVLELEEPEQALRQLDIALRIDPAHVDARNLRALALLRSGERGEAEGELDLALAEDPDNPLTHANVGWSRLHAGRHREALESFRESLRLDPHGDWARSGLIEALKARYFLYRWMLAYFLWLARMSPRARWGVVIGLFLLMRVSGGVARSNPEILGPARILQIALAAFFLASWVATPLFDLVLFLNPYGRYALDRDEKRAALCLGGYLLVALTLVLLALTVGPFSLVLPAVAFAAMSIPAANMFQVEARGPRALVLVFLIALLGMTLWSFVQLETTIVGSLAHSLAAGVLGLVLIASLASTWILNLLIGIRPKR